MPGARPTHAEAGDRDFLRIYSVTGQDHVEQGVHSYSRIVVLTAGTEPYWDRFR